MNVANEENEFTGWASASVPVAARFALGAGERVFPRDLIPSPSSVSFISSTRILLGRTVDTYRFCEMAGFTIAPLLGRQRFISIIPVPLPPKCLFIP